MGWSMRKVSQEDLILRLVIVLLLIWLGMQCLNDAQMSQSYQTKASLVLWHPQYEKNRASLVEWKHMDFIPYVTHVHLISNYIPFWIPVSNNLILLSFYKDLFSLVTFFQELKCFLYLYLVHMIYQLAVPLPRSRTVVPLQYCALLDIHQP